MDKKTDSSLPSSAVKEEKPPVKKKYRTRKTSNQTEAEESIVEMPNGIAVITNKKYLNAISFNESGNAYLQNLTSTNGLHFKSGIMYFDNLKEVSAVELQNMRTKEGIENIDLMTLRVFYSIILRKFESTGYSQIADNITLYLPDLAEYMGLQRNLNKDKIDVILDRAQSFHNIIGVFHSERNGKPSDSYFAVLNFDSYDDKKNTITFNSPYMNHLIQTIMDFSVRRTNRGLPIKKADGAPSLKAAHSWLINSHIAKEKNRSAVENVVIIVTLIEQWRNNKPEIKATELIRRNVQFENRLNESTNPRVILKRVFKNTWEYLRRDTKLIEAYEDIQLPDPEDPTYIPTTKTALENMVFRFPHKGKKKD